MQKAAMADHLCDLQIHVNGQQTFFLNQKIISKFSGRLKKMVINNQENQTTHIKNPNIIALTMDDFPGGPDAFELVTRFCYNKNGNGNGNDNGGAGGGGGGIKITVSNVSILYCCATYLDMNEKKSCNLLKQTETFLEGMFYWSWTEILGSLQSCEPPLLFEIAGSNGLLQKLILTLLSKIAQNSDENGIIAVSPSSSSSSPETPASGGLFRFSSSTKTTPESSSQSFSRKKEWWFDDLTILSPKIIEKVIKTLGAYGSENNSLILTKFLLHYLKTSLQRKKCGKTRSEYGGLADTAVYGVIMLGKNGFSCRRLFWVLRIAMLSGLGLSKECRNGLERLIGGLLDRATLDDLLVSSSAHHHHHHHDGTGTVYDVNLVLRLIRVFVVNNGGEDYDDDLDWEKMKKVGRLVDKYLREISPDHNLKMSKFLAVSESLPDSARVCFDGVYRAIDIYLESHRTLSFEERSRLCRCLNYEKLSLEACKDLAKNPRIPPRIAVEALMSQQSKTDHHDEELLVKNGMKLESDSDDQMILDYNYNFKSKKGIDVDDDGDGGPEAEKENEEMRRNLERMKWRVVELEKVCIDMKGQMSRLVVKNKVILTSSVHNRGLPRLC